MRNPFLYPGRGKALRRVTGSTGNTPYGPETTTIPDGEYSELIAAHDCRDLLFEFVFAAAATGTVGIEKVADETASTGGESFSSESVSAALTHNWSAGEPLIGFFRIKNASGQDLTAYCQKEI